MGKSQASASLPNKVSAIHAYTGWSRLVTSGCTDWWDQRVTTTQRAGARQPCTNRGGAMASTGCIGETVGSSSFGFPIQCLQLHSNICRVKFNQQLPNVGKISWGTYGCRKRLLASRVHRIRSKVPNSSVNTSEY